jgi:hypothetical protein
MKRNISGDHAIRRFFAEALHDSLRSAVMLPHDDVEEYLCQMMVDFLHRDAIFGLQDEFGMSLDAVSDMLAEGDVTMKANSFEREREVHKHIGDFLLFWSGVFPEFLRGLKATENQDALLDPIRQGKISYYVASTFDYGDYAREAPVLRKLSTDFEAYIYGLSVMRSEFLDQGASDWTDGFRA